MSSSTPSSTPFAASEYDVVVIGAGPSGATAATLVADRGYRVLVLEREIFPRAKVGESLMPETWTTLERLGLIDKLSASHFPKKYSVQFFGKSGRASSPFFFDESCNVASPQTWQVVRSEFDHLLAENAREHGAEVHYGVRVKDVLLDDGERATGVAVEGSQGPVTLGARVVIDASGQSSLLARKLSLQETDPKLRNASMYTYFRGAQRDEGRNSGATLILHTRQADSWFWFIPQPGDLASVGVVAPVEYLIRPPKRPPQEVFDRELATCEGLKDRLQDAEQVGPVMVLKDFTYRSRRRSGDGWVLVGDAYGFVDPLYSSGVMLALKSGEMAADAVADALDAGDPSAERLGRFEAEMLRGMEAIRKLVYAFYDKDFSIARFLERHPQHREDIVQILVGNVFRDDVDEVFVPMGEMTQLPANWAAEA